MNRLSIPCCLVAIVSCVVAASGPNARAALAGGSCPVNGLANGVSSLVPDDPATFRLNSVASG